MLKQWHNFLFFFIKFKYFIFYKKTKKNEILFQDDGTSINFIDFLTI
jgi:hypothetical protein